MSENFFEQLAANDPARPCVRLMDGALLSYHDLFAKSGRIANLLVSLGVKPGDRIAVQAEKSVPVLALYLATLRCGAVFLPLNTAYTLTEIRYFLGDAEPALIVCDPAAETGIRQAPECGGRVMTIDAAGWGTLPAAAAVMSADFAPVARTSEDLAAILYTSGTTGRSKGAMLTHGNLASNAAVLRDVWRFGSGDVLLHALPIYHAHGLFVAVNVTLLAGASMVFLPRFDPDAVIRAMPDCTVMMGVPTFYTRLLARPDLRAAARSGRLFISGSAPLLPETHGDWAEATGHAILERYGMTETGMLTSNPYDGDRIAGSVGFPLPGVDVRVVGTESRETLDADQVGMIEVKGPNVFRGYWRLPEKTAAEFRSDGFFMTGDLGRIDTRGYLHIVGREKDLIISGGLNVYPREVEAEIDALPGVLESAVIGLAHPDLGEGVTAVVVPRSADGDVDEPGILAALKGRLSKFKQPKRVLFADELPRNAMGKVQKASLRDRYQGLYAAPVARETEDCR